MGGSSDEEVCLQFNTTSSADETDLKDCLSPVEISTQMFSQDIGVVLCVYECDGGRGVNTVLCSRC